MTPDEEFLRRRKSRSVITALILGGLAVLFFFMTLAKIAG